MVNSIYQKEFLMQLDEFRANFFDKQGMRTSRFEVTCILPPDLARSQWQRDLRLRTETTSLPGVAIQLYDNIIHSGYGPVEARPWGTIQTDLTCIHLVDRKGEIYKLFVDWIALATGFATTSINDGVQLTGGSREGKSYTMEYKKKYATTVMIDVFDVADEKVLTVKLREAYPVSVDPIALSWGEQNAYSRLSVSYKFIDFTIT